MSNKKCCVPGCANGTGTQSNLHKFPDPSKDKERFNTWVYSIGGDILQLGNDHIFKYRRVCHVHFDPKYWCWNNRISNIAVPTNKMPGLTIAPIRDSTPVTHDEPLSPLNVTHVPKWTSTVGDDPCSPGLTIAPIRDSTPVTHDEPLSPRNVTPVPKWTNTVEDDPCSPEYTVVQKIQSEDAENIFSWQKSNEAVTIPEDDVQIEDIPNDMSMYVEEDDPTSPPHDPDTVSKEKPKSHAAFWCNMCNEPITGFRYTCVQCSDLDLCGACEADTQHSQHYVLRVPALRPITEVQSVLATIRRHLMHKLDPINEPEQDCGDAVSVKSEVKSEVDSDDDAPKNPLDDDDDGSRTSSQASGYEYLDEECSTDSIGEQKTRSHVEEPIVNAHELWSETNTTAESKTAIHTTGMPERDKKSPLIRINKTYLAKDRLKFRKNFDRSSATKTKDTEQVSSVLETKALKNKDEEIEQSQIKFGTIVEDTRLQGGGKDKLARIVQVKGLRLPTIPGYQSIKPGSLVRLMRLPANIQLNAKQKGPQVTSATHTTTTHEQNR